MAGKCSDDSDGCEATDRGMHCHADWIRQIEMTEQQVREQYEAWHRAVPDDGEGDTPWYRLIRAHLDPARDIAGKRVLEVACGRGGLACWLSAVRPPARPLVASDFATTAIARGRALASVRSGGIAWVVADIQTLPHANAVFDTVISCETVEHVPAPRRAIAEMTRLLRPGGKLLLTTPNYLGPMGLYRAYLRVRGRPYKEVGQPINQLTLLPLTMVWVRRAGLRVLTHDGIGHYLPFPGRPPIEFRRLDSPRTVMRWFALHSLVVAEKP